MLDCDMFTTNCTVILKFVKHMQLYNVLILLVYMCWSLIIIIAINIIILIAIIIINYVTGSAKTRHVRTW